MDPELRYNIELEQQLAEEESQEAELEQQYQRYAEEEMNRRWEQDHSEEMEGNDMKNEAATAEELSDADPMMAPADWYDVKTYVVDTSSCNYTVARYAKMASRNKTLGDYVVYLQRNQSSVSIEVLHPNKDRGEDLYRVVLRGGRWVLQQHPLDEAILAAIRAEEAVSELEKLCKGLSADSRNVIGQMVKLYAKEEKVPGLNPEVWLIQKRQDAGYVVP